MVAGYDGLGLRAVIEQEDHELATVIAVHYANLVGRRQMALGGHAAAGVDEAGTALGHRHGKARRDEGGLAGGDGDRFLQAGVEVRACGKFGAVGGHNRVGGELFIFYSFFLILSMTNAEKNLNIL